MATSTLTAVEAEPVVGLPFAPAWFGTGAIVLFGLILTAPLAFQNASNRH